MSIIVIDTIEAADALVGRLRPTEAPFPIQRQHAVAFALPVGNEIGTCQLTIDLQHVIVLPVVMLFTLQYAFLTIGHNTHSDS